MLECYCSLYFSVVYRKFTAFRSEQCYTVLLYSSRTNSEETEIFQFVFHNLVNIKLNKTARIRAKCRIFRLPYKFYGAVITLKK